MRHQKKMNKYERREFQKAKLARDTQGTGRYLFRNNSDCDLILPKLLAKGGNKVGPREEFEGDSYFLKMVPRQLLVIREIESPLPRGAETMSEKLILDQPPTITTGGTVEHHVVKPGAPAAKPVAGTPAPKPVHEKAKPPVDALITEDPLEGVVILD